MDDKEISETYTNKTDPEFYPTDDDQTGSLATSNEFDYLKFQNLLAQYKTKVFEQQAYLFQL